MPTFKSIQPTLGNDNRHEANNVYCIAYKPKYN